MAKLHWRFILRRWHRRIGVVAALFVLLLVITGVLLNHSHELGLDARPLEAPWLRHYYGLAPDDDQGLRHQLSAGELRVRSARLQLNHQVLAPCARLVGVIEQGDMVLAACSDRLILLTADGQLVDQADAVRGVPEGLSALAQQEGRVLLRRGDTRFLVDLADLSIHPTSMDFTASGRMPSTPDMAVESVDWERVLLDLHSGRLLGRFGPWLMDAMALLFALLAVSGLVMARRRHGG